VYAVIDLGVAVNPDNVKNQVEGAIVMALGAAVKPGITLENGMVHNIIFMIIHCRASMKSRKWKC
jgi:isoquinoline 1-oxidoreductase beta subunit